MVQGSSAVNMTKGFGFAKQTNYSSVLYANQVSSEMCFLNSSNLLADDGLCDTYSLTSYNGHSVVLKETTFLHKISNA